MAAPKKNPGNMCLYVCVSRGCFRHRSALANGFDDDDDDDDDVAPSSLMMMSRRSSAKKKPFSMKKRSVVRSRPHTHAHTHTPKVVERVLR